MDTASRTTLISASWVETNTPDKPAMYPWSCSRQQHSKQRVIFLKTPHNSSFRKILIVQQRKGKKKPQPNKGEGGRASMTTNTFPSCTLWLLETVGGNSDF